MVFALGTATAWSIVICDLFTGLGQTLTAHL